VKSSSSFFRLSTAACSLHFLRGARRRSDELQDQIRAQEVCSVRRTGEGNGHVTGNLSS
jgi:hypothetical protein